jgi:hypothetical protein
MPLFQKVITKMRTEESGALSNKDFLMVVTDLRRFFSFKFLICNSHNPSIFMPLRQHWAFLFTLGKGWTLDDDHSNDY